MDSFRNASSHDAMPPVLVAGCGDLGQRVAQRLQTQGYRVLGLRRRQMDQGGPVQDWLQADLAEPSSLRLIPSAIDTVLYTPTPGARTPEAYQRVFIEGLQHLLDRLKPERLRRLVLVSSTAVYGEHAGAWLDETAVPAPLGFNGQLLLQAEAILARRCPHAGVVVRLGGLYGPGRGHWLRRLQQGAVQVPRQQAHWSNRMHSDDAAQLLSQLLLASTPEPLYLGVDGQPLRLDHFYDAMAAALGLPAPAEGPPPAGIGNKRLRSRYLAQLGFSPRWPDAITGCRQLLADGELLATPAR